MKRGNIYKLIPFLLGTLLLPWSLFAQIKLTLEQSRDKLVSNKIGRHFALNEQMKTVDGKDYDFSHIRRPAFIYIGEEYCVVCKFEFPTFIEMSKQFPEIDFIYLSADADSIIRKKLGNAVILRNLYAIRVENNFLWDKDIAKVYPVKYFLNSKGIVEDAATGGRMKDRQLVREGWRPILEKLK